MKAGWFNRAAATGFVLCAASAGCASSEATTSLGGDTLRSSNSRTITYAEITSLGGANAFDIVSRLHPNWLRSAGARSRSTQLPTEIVVVVSGRYFGPVNSLRQIPVNVVGEIQYLTGNEALNRFPSLASGRHVEAAILVFHVGANP